MITARGLARRFVSHGRTIDAVRGVDLNVAPGEIVAFLGPNGAGKTTTLRMLATLLRPTSGTAIIAGHDLMADPIKVRQNIGYVAQDGGTVAERKVIEEIELQGRLYRLSKVDAARRAGTMIDQLDLTGLDQRLCGSLSGGQRRRLDIALGLVHSPSLVFLDEPTSGLDPQSRINLWNHIRAIREDHGVAIFLTTHYLEEADLLADRVIVIDQGRIVAEETPDRLKSVLSGDRVTLTVLPDWAPTTVRVLEGLPGVADLRIEQPQSQSQSQPQSQSQSESQPQSQVHFRVPAGDQAVPVILRTLEAAGVVVGAVGVHRASLDDVFFALTGTGLRDEGDAQASTPAPPATPAASAASFVGKYGIGDSPLPVRKVQHAPRHRAETPEETTGAA